MALYEKQKLIFLHIPKVAGTSIKTLLDEELGTGLIIYNNAHDEVEKIINPDNYNIFCVVRDPISRVKSYYKWFRNSTDIDRHPHKKIALDNSFEDWIIKWYLPEGRPQARFFLLDGKVLSNITILRYENMKEELNRYLNTKLNLNINIDKLPHLLRVNKKEDLTCSEETTQKIKDKEVWLYDNGFYK